MTEIPFEKVAEATRRMERYHVQFEQSPGIIYEGEIDLAGDRQYIRTRGSFENCPQAEMIWTGEQGYGRRINTEPWLLLRGKPFPNYLQSALEMLLAGPVTSIEAEGALWKARIEVKHIPLFEESGHLYRAIFKKLDFHDERLLGKMAELSRGMSIVTHLWISRKDFQIKRFTVKGQSPSFNTILTVTFSEPMAEIPHLSANTMKAATTEMPVPALQFLTIPRLGGWQQTNSHCPWAQRSLALIKTKDSAKAYEELYDTYWSKAYQNDVDTVSSFNVSDPKFHHPIEVGAYFEDEKRMPSFYGTWFGSDQNYAGNTAYYFPASDYRRDCHHYGGEDDGLEWEWYFTLYGSPNTTVGNRFYSARNWGYGGTKVLPALNRLTFTEAIKQYNRYSLDGKRCAYLMLGHVLHLLQDQGEPDHAELVVHPGSAMNEPGADDTFHTCIVLAAEIVYLPITPGLLSAVFMGDISTILANIPIILLGALFFGIAYGACEASLDENEKGYERLVGDDWLPKMENRIGTAIKKAGPKYKATYDAFFKEMATMSKNARNQTKQNYPNLDLLDCPLGLGVLKAIPPIPGCDPDIDSTDSSQTTPFFELTDTVAFNAICYGAGFVQRFYEIVNHPPYVENVVVVKAVPGLTPTGFGKFKQALYLAECDKAQIRYQASWSVTNATDRALTVESKHISPDHAAYIFIQFGPNIEPGKSKQVNTSTLKLTLTGTAPDKTAISIPVTLKEASDSTLGTYYWGSCQPSNSWGKAYKLTLETHAHDASAHFMARTSPGDEIDAHPEKIAHVNPDDPTNYYPFTGYKPGVDKNHKIEIGLPIKADALEVNQPITSATKVNLVPDSKSPVTTVEYQDLTLHSASDADFYHIHFQTSKVDDMMGDGAKREFGKGSGLHLTSFSCRLEILAEEEYGACLNLHLYNSQTTNISNYPYTKQITLKRPQDTFADKNFYLAVKNPDFTLQGKLRYNLSITYYPGGYSVDGRLLYKFWEVTHGPWPPPPEQGYRMRGDPPEEIYYHDLRELVSDLKQYLPVVIQGLKDPLDKARSRARMQLEIGILAHSAGLFQDAEKFIRNSSQGFRRLGMKAQENRALQGLKATYLSQNKMEDAARIGRMLGRSGK